MVIERVNQRVTGDGRASKSVIRLHRQAFKLPVVIQRVVPTSKFFINRPRIMNMLRLSCRVLLAASLLCQLGQAPAYADNTNLPDLGDESLAVISPAQERKLGEDLMRQARRSLDFMDDPEVTGYIQSLGEKLVVHSDDPQLDFRFFVINNPVINAFAIPGGFICVHTGLILATQNEA